MAPPNALSMVKSDVSMLLTSMKYSPRSNFRSTQDESKRALLNSLTLLRRTLNEASDLESVAPLTYLTPFLDIIRSETTTGPITGLALTSVEKFLAYGLLEVSPGSPNASANIIGITMEAVAEAVIQARFIRSRLSSDEVVLMKIVHLFRTLLLIPSGCLLSNEIVFEILQNCLRICLESQLSELLRRTAELFLASIVQLFFSRVPALLLAANVGRQAQEEDKKVEVERMEATRLNDGRMSKRGSRKSTIHLETPMTGELAPSYQGVEAETEESLEDNRPHRDESVCSLGEHLVAAPPQTPEPKATSTEVESLPPEPSQSPIPCNEAEHVAEIQSQPEDRLEADVPNYQVCRPYDLQVVYDLFALLVGLLNPEQNQEPVIKVALNLLTVALETGVDFLHACPSILRLVADDMTKHLMMLLYRERISLFATILRVAFLLFEGLRVHLKLQLEVYFQRLIALISSDNERIAYEHREIALDAVVQFFLLPGLAVEIYVNYDCDPYCSNLFEDITEMLTKNVYPVNRFVGTNLLALDALLTLIDAIDAQTGGSASEEANVQAGGPRGRRLVRPNRHWIPSSFVPSQSSLAALKARKKLLMSGSDRFNLKPKDGIAFLQKNGLLADPLDPTEMAAFLAENPRLDKKTIGEYLSNRKNTHILVAFVRHFNFRGTRIDEALRAYLEAFRIPGEAPLIQHLMESFAEQWFEANDAPFADVDAAFTLSYALLMLNTDQHNPNSRRQNVPMTCADFSRNLKGMNGGRQFDPILVNAVYESIRGREIVMPSEQTGAVKDNYLWKCLFRRSCLSSFNHYMNLPPGQFDEDIFLMIWGSTVAALSFVLDKSTDATLQAKTLKGFVACSRIAAHFRMTEVFDNLVVSLCKFTLLLNATETPESVAVSLGRSAKAQIALRLVFALAAIYGDILREGWCSLLSCLLGLLRSRLLPPALVRSPLFFPTAAVSDNFVASVYSNEFFSGTGSRTDAGVLSSFYNYLTLGPSFNSESLPLSPPDSTQHHPFDGNLTTSSQARSFSSSSSTDLFRLIDESAVSGPTAVAASQSVHDDDPTAIRTAKAVVEACQIGAHFEESKFLMLESLQELVKALLCGLTKGDFISDTYESVAPEIAGGGRGEQSQVFCLELLLQILLYNRDRIDQLWFMVCGHLVETLRNAREPTFLVECVVAGILRLALRLLRRQQDLVTQILAYLLTVLLERGPYLLRPSLSLSFSANFTAANAAAASGVTSNNRRLLPHHRSPEITPTGVDGGGEGVKGSSVARQVVCGVNALLTGEDGVVAVEVSSPRDWQLIFRLLEVCGAGAFPITPEELEGQTWSHQGPGQQESRRMRKEESMYSSLQNVTTDGGVEHSRDYASDNDAEGARSLSPPSSLVGAKVESWVLVNVVDKAEETDTEKRQSGKKFGLIPSCRLRLPIAIIFQDWFALEMAFESIAFVVRDPTHITPKNIEYCIHTLRVFIEAVLAPPKPSFRKAPMKGVHENLLDSSEGRPPEPFATGIALQFLELVYVLFSRVPSIYAEWTKPIEMETDSNAEPSTSTTTVEMADVSKDSLWPACWRALLQAMARLCVDARRDVHIDALAYLQRALLSPILHLLTGPQWLDCFLQVLFPLLTNFLEGVSFDETTTSRSQVSSTSGITSASSANRLARAAGSQDNLFNGGFFSNIFGAGSGKVETISTTSTGIGSFTEYTDPRMRAIPLLTKVFLQHLSPLYALDYFPQLWQLMLTYSERFLKANISDSLNDAVRESLKNLLLVLYTGTQHTTPILVRNAPEGSREALLWSQTCCQLASFMPDLMDQLFPPPPPPPKTTAETATITAAVDDHAQTPISTDPPSPCVTLQSSTQFPTSAVRIQLPFVEDSDKEEEDVH